MMRMLGLAGVVAIAMGVLGMPGMPQAHAQSGWQQITPVEPARLYVDPTAFGSQGIQQLYRRADGMRYEVWSTRFDLTLRSFQIMLFQTEESIAVRPPGVRSVVADMLRNAVDEAIVWGDGMELATGLGLATVERFQVAGSVGCVGFTIDVPRIPDVNLGLAWRNGVQGFYCDPITSRIPDRDIEQTLKVIGVDGVFIPQP